MIMQPFKKGDRVRFRLIDTGDNHLISFVQRMPRMTVRAIRPEDECASGWLITVRVGWLLSGAYYRDYDSSWFERIPR